MKFTLPLYFDKLQDVNLAKIFQKNFQELFAFDCMEKF